MFEKQIKINCSWIPSEGKSTTNGHAWRLWTINLEASKVDLSEYIDHVEYILHESFGSPPIVCKEPPYTLQREGWGEFDLRILFHLSDLSISSPQTIVFDLNFKKPKYCKYKKITLRSDTEYIEEDFIEEEEYEIKAPPHRRRLRRRRRLSSRNTYGKKSEHVSKRQRAISSASPSSITSSITTYASENNKYIQQDQAEQHQIQKQVQSHQQNQQHERHQHQHQHQHQRHEYKQETVSGLPHHILDPKNNLNLVLETETIDLGELKALLEALDESNLRKALRIIFSYDTSTHIIEETDDGYYMIDITCACSDLVNKLWEFVIDVEIEKCREGSKLSEGAKEQH